MNMRALLAEVIGTFALVLCGCGAMLLAPPQSGGGVMAVAAAFGFSVAAMAYAVGHVSGGHFNPAVTVGLAIGGRFPVAQAPAYIVAQVMGAIAACAVLSVVLAAAPQGANVPRAPSLASIANVFGGQREYGMGGAFLLEAVMAALLLVVMMGATSKHAPPGFIVMAPIAIGASVAAFHLLALSVTNAGLNPARATATAMFGGGKAIGDLWLFWAAPMLGASLGAALSRWMQGE